MNCLSHTHPYIYMHTHTHNEAYEKIKALWAAMGPEVEACWLCMCMLACVSAYVTQCAVCICTYMTACTQLQINNKCVYECVCVYNCVRATETNQA